jgi:hypothetical protein
MGVSVDVHIMAALIFHKAFYYGVSALVPEDACQKGYELLTW